MRWDDEAVLLGVVRPSPGALALETMTRNHGRVRGVMAIDPAGPPSLPPGALVTLSARYNPADDHARLALGQISGGVGPGPGNEAKLAALASVRSLSVALLALREPHQPVYAALCALAAALSRDDGRWPLDYARWEFAVLDALGHVAGVRRCRSLARGGEVVYMSPRSGTLVARTEAGAFLDRMLPVPGFLLGARHANIIDVRQALDLTGHVIRHIARPGVDPGEDRAALVRILAGMRRLPPLPPQAGPPGDDEDADARERRIRAARPLVVASVPPRI